MIKVGITGQAGFIGTHLYNTLGLYKEEFERISFEDAYFTDERKLRGFVKQCDVVVHFAAVNRCDDPDELYRTNLRLVERLIDAMEAEKATPYVLFSSSTQEELDNEYGRSKREGRALLEKWAGKNGASFTGMVVPNVYGPYGRPNYNSFIATFAYKITRGEQPEIRCDQPVRLIYVDNLCRHILGKIRERYGTKQIERDLVPFDFERTVSGILHLFERFHALYVEQGIIPDLKDRNDLNLFNTFRAYLDTARHFPVELVMHTDDRGMFVETIRLEAGGQVSFSTTRPGVTRGNHYHTRKIERFTVIKGKACIRIRKIGTQEIIEYLLDGDRPAYVDMPVWYTHTISNIGTDDLYAQFWINEWYDPADGDTYFEPVG